MIRIVLADDVPLIRAGVRAVVETGGDIEVVGEAADGRAAVELVRARRPDVVVLDIVMPHLDGIAATAEIQRLAPQVGVILLTTFSEDEHIARALSAGASGFLLKAGDPRELLAGIRAVADGAAALSPTIAKRVITELNAGPAGRRMSRGVDARARVGRLTPREREVLTLVGAGLSNAEIGRRLHVAEGTVKIFVSAILRSLGVRNRVQIAIVAFEAGLVSED